MERLEVSPLQIVQDCVSLMRGRADEKGISLECEYRFPIPKKVRTDPVRLRSDPRESGGQRGEVHGHGRGDGAGEPHARARVRFEVADTGIGLDAEQKSRLFADFSQGDTSMTRRYGGTGLGFRSHERLSQMLGGDISVESEPGKGSVFTLTIDAEGAEEFGLATDAQGFVVGGAELR